VKKLLEFDKKSLTL